MTRKASPNGSVCGWRIVKKGVAAQKAVSCSMLVDGANVMNRTDTLQ